MKFFALLPLASLFLGAMANPVSVDTALEPRAAANPAATLQQFSTDSKQYTDAIRKSLLLVPQTLLRRFKHKPYEHFPYIRILTLIRCCY
jgi:hypothetical protein